MCSSSNPARLIYHLFLDTVPGSLEPPVLNRVFLQIFMAFLPHRIGLLIPTVVSRVKRKAHLENYQ